jgi:hypothetical protein
MRSQCWHTSFGRARLHQAAHALTGRCRKNIWTLSWHISFWLGPGSFRQHTLSLVDAGEIFGHCACTLAFERGRASSGAEQAHNQSISALGGDTVLDTQALAGSAIIRQHTLSLVIMEGRDIRTRERWVYISHSDGKHLAEARLCFLHLMSALILSMIPPSVLFLNLC